MSIFVTGALGNVGAEVINQLQQLSQPVRAAGRDVGAISRRFGGDVEPVVFDFERPATYRSAFEGVERVFLIRPPAISNVRRAIIPALEVAQRAGVRHLVFLSLIGVEKNRVVPHYKIEQHLLRSGLGYTFLRPSFFMQNMNTTHRAEIKDRDEIFVPAGSGKTSFIDVRDIAAVAVRALTEDGHAGKIYNLTGAEALDYDQVAALLSLALRRPITYRRPSLLRFVARQLRQGTPLPFTLVMAGIYTTARLGLAGRLTNDLPRLLGRAPISFRQYVEDYQACWQPAAPEPARLA